MREIAPAQRGRNLVGFVLASALVALGLGLAPAGSLHASRPPATRWFWVQQSGIPVRLTAKLRASAPHVSVYAIQGVAVSANDAHRIARQFQRSILPVDKRLFGDPGRMEEISIVLAPLSGLVLGYFNQADLEPLVAPGQPGNHGNVLYARPPALMPEHSTDQVEEVLAHELQHLINFRIRVINHRYPREERWLNEGLSFYAQLANGFWSSQDRSKLVAASRNPGWPVTMLNNSDRNRNAHFEVEYGRAGLFVTYLAEQYGPTFTRDVIACRETGMAAVNATVAHLSPGTTAASEFGHFGVAADLAGQGPDGYGRLSGRLKARPASYFPSVNTYPFMGHVDLVPWAQAYVRFGLRQQGVLELEVTGPPHRYLAALITTDADRMEPPVVRWLRIDGYGRTLATVPLTGGSATLVLNRVANTGCAGCSSGTGAASGFAVSASVHVSQYHRIVGPAAAAGSHANLSIR